MEVVTIYQWFYDCDAEQISSSKNLEKMVCKAITAADFKLMHSHAASYGSYLVALAVVAESHLILHAEPHKKELVAEIASCVGAERAQVAINVVKNLVKHTRTKTFSTKHQHHSDPFDSWPEASKS